MSGKDDNKGGGEMAWVAGFVVAAITIWLIWTFARKPIVFTVFYMDWLQVKAVEAFRELGPIGSWVKAETEKTFSGVYDPQSISWQNLKDISGAVGRQMRWYLAALIAAMSVLTLFKMKGNGFRRIFSLAGGKNKGPSLLHYQSHHWKVTMAAATFNPSTKAPAEGPALTPMEWLRDNKVTLTEDDGLDSDAAEKAFAKQLGDQWKGLHRAPVYVQAVAVICGLSARRAKDTMKVKEALAQVWSGPKAGAEARMREILKPYLADQALVKSIETHAAKHAFVNTAMFSVLDWARKKGGVLASAEFRWLKPVDRHLWYTLNNCGRRAYLVEGAGAVAHFFAERVLGTPLGDPRVAEAIDGIDEYLDEQGIMDLEEFFRVQQKQD